MGAWSKQKVNPSNINNGNEYEKGDRVSRQALNSIVNNSLYAADRVDAPAQQISYLTTAPTEPNTSGSLIIVVLNSEPATKYAGYIYYITEA